MNHIFQHLCRKVFQNDEKFHPTIFLKIQKRRFSGRLEHSTRKTLFLALFSTFSVYIVFNISWKLLVKILCWRFFIHFFSTWMSKICFKRSKISSYHFLGNPYIDNWNYDLILLFTSKKCVDFFVVKFLVTLFLHQK